MQEASPECVFDRLSNHRYIFLTGRAGSGKSFTTNEVAIMAKEQGWKVLLTATTGIAATGLSPDAKTIHSLLRFGICNSIGDYNSSTYRFTRIFPDFNQDNAGRPHLLVIDEASMLSSNTFDLIMHIIQTKLHQFNIMILLVGDMAQLPPVIKNTDDNLLIHNEMFNLQFEHILLRINKRNTNADFNVFLNRIRDCEYNHHDQEFVENSAFFEKKDSWTEVNEETTIVAPVNKEVSEVNAYFLAKIVGEDKHPILLKPTLQLTNSFIEEVTNKLGFEEFNKLFPNIKEDNNIFFEVVGKMSRVELNVINKKFTSDRGFYMKSIFNTAKELYEKFYKKQVMLKVSAKLINNVNRFDEEGRIELPNGAMGHLRYTDERSFYFEDKDGRIFDIHTERKVIYTTKSGTPIRLCSFIIPSVDLSYAITIHRAQGSSLDSIYFNPSRVFEYAQVYVALSRLKSGGKIYSPVFDYGRHLIRKQDITDYLNRIESIGSKCDEEIKTESTHNEFGNKDEKLTTIEKVDPTRESISQGESDKETFGGTKIPVLDIDEDEIPF